jgi:amidase
MLTKHARSGFATACQAREETGVIAPPTLDDISGLSRAMGLGLEPDEVELVRDFVAASLPALDIPADLLRDEPRLPRTDVARTGIRQPLPAEDPFNAFITRCHIAGSDAGALSDTRVGLKDHISVAGVPLTFGCRFLEGYVPSFDATVVTRLIRAGATISGKLNMEAFSCGAGLSGYRDYGRVLNPWDVSRSAGGSSSGSGAAVAARMLDVAFGGDQGGSVRLPASWCGVAGLKPTHGLIPHTGAFGMEFLHDHLGVLALSVADVARVAETVAGPDGYDARQDPARSAPQLISGLKAGIAGTRIGVLAEGFSASTQGDVRDAVMAAAEVFRSCGATVCDMSVPLHTSAAAVAIPLLATAAGSWFDMGLTAPQSGYVPTELVEAVLSARRRGAKLPVYVAAEALLGRYIIQTSAGLLARQSANLRSLLISGYESAFEQVDLLIMPTVPFTAPLYEESASPAQNVELSLTGGTLGSLDAIVENLWPFNFVGLPALTVPCALSAGLPVGLQIVGRAHEDDLVLRAGYAFESAVDWDELTTPPFLADIGRRWMSGDAG